MNENEIGRITVDGAVEVHRTLGGPGLLEVVNEDCGEGSPASRHRRSVPTGAWTAI